MKKNGKEKLWLKDVNKIFGWAIHSVRKKKQNQSFKVKEAGGDRAEIEAEIQLLKSMVFRKEEALLNPDYVEKCLDPFMRSFEKGGLTLVNPRHFDYGAMVMRKVSEAVTTTKLKRDLSVTRCEKRNLLADKQLLKTFLETTAGHQGLDKQGKKKVLSEILQKVVHCKFSDVMNMVHEQNIARGSEKNVTRAGQTTRGPLDILNAVKEDRKKRCRIPQSK